MFSKLRGSLCRVVNFKMYLWFTSFILMSCVHGIIKRLKSPMALADLSKRFMCNDLGSFVVSSCRQRKLLGSVRYFTNNRSKISSSSTLCLSDSLNVLQCLER